MGLAEAASGYIKRKVSGRGDQQLKVFYIKKSTEVADWKSGLAEATFPVFLKDDIQESFAPSWDEEPMFGRVDSVARYTNTKRTISFSFLVLTLKGLAGGLKKKGFNLTGSGVTSISASAIQSGELPDEDYVKAKGMDHLNNFKTKAMGITQFTDYHIFDDQDACLDKIEFLRSLTYPKFANGAYVQPPMVHVSLGDQLWDVRGYITDLSISHQVVTGLGVDTNMESFLPHSWEVSITMTVLHSQPPTAEGPIF